MILGLSSFAFAWSIGMDGAIPRHRLTAMPYIPYIPYTPISLILLPPHTPLTKAMPSACPIENKVLYFFFLSFNELKNLAQLNGFRNGLVTG
jgi:hypothetical protein